jgi:hypothetical protein
MEQESTPENNNTDKGDEIVVTVPTKEEIRDSLFRIKDLADIQKFNKGEVGERYLKLSADLHNDVKKRVLGRVTNTQEVKPRKRVKLVAQAPNDKEERDYKQRFERLYKLVREDDELKQHVGICGGCREVCDGDDGKDWHCCQNCRADICPRCLPTTTTPDQSKEGERKVKLIYYCHECREVAEKDLMEEEPGYTIMQVDVGGLVYGR